MNNNVNINPTAVIEYNFKHAFSYRLLWYLLSIYDVETRRVGIDKQRIIKELNSSYYSVNSALDELVGKHVITKLHWSNIWYSISPKVLIKVK